MAKKPSKSPDISAEGVQHLVRIAPEKKSKRKPSSLNEHNHGWYTGKLAQSAVGWRNWLRRVFGFEDKIYDQPFYQGSIDYLDEVTVKGMRPMIRVCPTVSEIVNGPEDVEGHFSGQDQVEWIKGLAHRKFGLSEEDIQVENIEDLPEHSGLFNLLRGLIPVMGSSHSTFEKVFGCIEDLKIEKVRGEYYSYEIAAVLYQTMLESDDGQENQLLQAFRSLVPEKLKKKAAEDPNSIYHYYGLLEIAIRITDLLNGRFIQGGADRQERYDDVITNLMIGEKGRFKGIEGLQSLFDLLKDCPRFEAMYLHTEKNHYKKSFNRIVKWARGILATIGVVGLSYGGVLIGQSIERSSLQRREKKIEQLTKRALKGVAIQGPHLPHLSDNDPPKNLITFHSIKRSILVQLERRYNINEDLLGTLRPMVHDFLLNMINREHYLNNEAASHIDFADLFVDQNRALMIQLGVSPQPYNNLLFMREDLFKLYNKKAKSRLVSPTCKDRHPASSHQSTLGEKCIRLYKMAAFTDYNGQKFEFYRTKQGDVVARDRSLEYGKEKKIFSTSRAQWGARMLITDLERSDVVRGLHSIRVSIKRLSLMSKQEHCECAKQSVTHSESTYYMYHPFDYKDSFGRFAYQVVHYPMNDRRRKYPYCILARKNNEKHYTYKRGLEVAKRYHQAHLLNFEPDDCSSGNKKEEAKKPFSPK